MKNKYFILSFFLLLTANISFADKYLDPGTETSGWQTDILSDGFQRRFVSLGKDFDGPARCTVVRKQAKGHPKKALLYIHGFNDYFFQKEFANRFVDSCYSFYAVDLRRYGRSLEPWQYPFNIWDMRTYFQELDSAINIIHKDSIYDITLYGHSTGGLTTALFTAERGARSQINRLILDSPFIEWNFNSFYRNFLIPIIQFYSNISKETKIKQGHCDGYAYSLLKQYHGEWEYDTEWKMIYSPPVTTGWVNAITAGQKLLMKHAGNITVPVLLVCSNRKISGCDWTPEFMTGDAVLDPEMLQKRGRKLGQDPEIAVIPSALHNTILSPLPSREDAYDAIFTFLMKNK